MYRLLIVAIVVGLSLPCLGGAEDLNVQTRREATGVVIPKRSVFLAAKIMGRINAVHFEEGDKLKAGELLIALDNAEWHAELASAQASVGMARAELEHARREEERVKKLYRAKTLSEDELDDAALAHSAAQEQLKMAQASVVKAQAVLDETRILAPFPGIIVRKEAEIGQLTQPGEMLLVLEDHSQLKLRSRVKEHDVAHISIGQSATVTIDALDGLAIRGTVSKIIPSGDLSTHAFVVEVTLPAQDKLYPGMFGKADFGL